MVGRPTSGAPPPRPGDSAHQLLPTSRPGINATAKYGTSPAATRSHRVAPRLDATVADDNTAAPRTDCAAALHDDFVIVNNPTTKAATASCPTGAANAALQRDNIAHHVRSRPHLRALRQLAQQRARGTLRHGDSLEDGTMYRAVLNFQALRVPTKHRLHPTAPLAHDDSLVPADRLLDYVPGQAALGNPNLLNSDKFRADHARGCTAASVRGRARQVAHTGHHILGAALDHDQVLTEPAAPASATAPPATITPGSNDRYDGTIPLPDAAAFDPKAPFKDFGGDFRRFDWHTLCAEKKPCHLDVPTLLARERELAGDHSNFSRRMTFMIESRGFEQVRPSCYDLHRWLDVLAEDQHEAGSCDVWFLISRGYSVLPHGTVHPRQDTANYQSVHDHPEAFDSECSRLLQEGYIKEYDVAASEAGYADVPVVCVLACGIVIKLTPAGIKLRLVCDGSAPHDGSSLNETMEDQICNLASVEKAAQSCSKHGFAFTIDECDAYMQTPCSAYSVRFLGIRWRGKIFAYTVMNFGLSSACGAQQSIAVALHRAVRRRLVSGGLHCNPTANFDQVQPWVLPVNEQRQRVARAKRKAFTNKHRDILSATEDDGDIHTKIVAENFYNYVHVPASAKKTHAPDSANKSTVFHRAAKLLRDEKHATRRISSCSSLYQYLDDMFAAFTDRRSAVWSFLISLSLFLELNVRVNKKPGKTCFPAQRFEFLGVSFDLRQFRLYLSATKVDILLSSLTAAIEAGSTTFGDLESLVGVLVWSSAVIEVRPYYRSLLNILTNTCPTFNGRRHRAAKHTLITFSDVELRDLRAWLVILRVFNGCEIERGIRRQISAFELLSDASGTGLGYSYAGVYGHMEVPASWSSFIFARSDSHVRILVGRLEAWALLEGLRYACPRCSGKLMTLRARTDNIGLCYQVRKLSSKDIAVQPILREIMWLLAVHGVRLQMDFIPGVENVFTDALSRLTQPDAHTRAAALAACKAKAAIHLVQATKMGVHAVGALARPDLLPFLEAERCSALDFDDQWSEQSRAGLDAVLDEWLTDK